MTRYLLTLSGGSRNTLTPEIIEADHYTHNPPGWIAFLDAEGHTVFEANATCVESIEHLGISSVDRAAKKYRAAIREHEIARAECVKHNFANVPEALEKRRVDAYEAMREAETALINTARGTDL